MFEVLAVGQGDAGRELHRLPGSAQGAVPAPTALDAAEMATLDTAFAPDKVAGPRYGPKLMAMLDR